MSVNVYLDTRRKLSDGLFPLKIQIAFNRKQALYNTGYKISAEQWNDVAKMVIKHPRRNIMNLRLNEFICCAEDYQYECAKRNIKIAPNDVKNHLVDTYTATYDKIEHGAFLTCFTQYMNSRSTESTKQSLRSTLHHIERFESNVDKMSFDDINKDWLVRFDAHLSKTAKSVNARNVYMRNLRAVFNYAIDNDITKNYPFRRYKLKNVETAKRSLTVKEVRTLMSKGELSPETQFYIDIFILIIYLCGINIIDLSKLNINNIYNNITMRLEYNRSKTRKLYSVKLEPEALCIIEKYRGKKYLLNILDNYKDYKNFTKRFNREMKNISNSIHSFPTITSYWARHTWASLAAELNIPDEVIAMGLGHSSELKTTNIYIKRNLDKLDEANRKIIDYILQK